MRTLGCGAAALVLALPATACSGDKAADKAADGSGDTTADTAADGSGDTTADTAADTGTDIRLRCSTEAAFEAPACVAADYEAPPRPAPTPEATRLPISVRGRDLVASDGSLVSLRGVNFGSWLMAESWFSGMGPYVNEDVFLEAAFAKADELGVRARMTRAYGTILIEWMSGNRGRFILFEEMRRAMYRTLPDADRPAVDALWT
jgi:hypothetical protein